MRTTPTTRFSVRFRQNSNGLRGLDSWAITVLTTVGFGDIGPSTSGEMVFSCFAEMAGCFTFAILMGSVSALLTGQRLLSLQVNEKMTELTEYLRQNDIEPELRTRIRLFMQVRESSS